MKNPESRGRVVGLILSAALLAGPSSFALDDPQPKTDTAELKSEAEPTPKPSAQEPTKKRHQRFVAEDAGVIKKRLEAYNKLVKREDRVHCAEEAVIGSHFIVDRCVTGEMRERERIFARKEIERIRRNALMQ
jgi:hypothetical protein